MLLNDRNKNKNAGILRITLKQRFCGLDFDENPLSARQLGVCVTDSRVQLEANQRAQTVHLHHPHHLRPQSRPFESCLDSNRCKVGQLGVRLTDMQLKATQSARAVHLHHPRHLHHPHRQRPHCHMSLFEREELQGSCSCKAIARQCSKQKESTNDAQTAPKLLL